MHAHSVAPSDVSAGELRRAQGCKGLLTALKARICTGVVVCAASKEMRAVVVYANCKDLAYNSCITVEF